MLALTLPTSGSLSVGIVRSRTEVTEFFFHFGLLEGQKGGRIASDERQGNEVTRYTDFIWSRTSVVAVMNLPVS
jgi:hypothetical protein